MQNQFTQTTLEQQVTSKLKHQLMTVISLVSINKSRTILGGQSSKVKI